MAYVDFETGDIRSEFDTIPCPPPDEFLENEAERYERLALQAEHDRQYYLMAARMCRERTGEDSIQANERMAGA